MKPLTWLGRSREAVRAFPELARQRIGYELLRLQEGDEPTDWKPMRSIGPGVREIRVHARGEFRITYVISSSVYILHAFVKKTRKTSQHDLDVAKVRLRELMRNDL